MATATPSATPRQPVTILSATAGEGGLTLSLASCHGRPQVSLRESATEILLSATADEGSDHWSCSDVLDVSLREPVRQRVVRDATSGHVLLDRRS
jgi:hypothetical protein